MSQKFHVNPGTGNPNICRAQPGKCPYGDVPHYDSRSEARTGYEESNSAETFKSSVAKTPRVTLDDEGYLTSKWAREAAPKGVYCPHCGFPANEFNASILVTDCETLCLSCEKNYTLESATVIIAEDSPSSKFFSKTETLGATWYHATDSDNWLEQIDGDPDEVEFHLGTETAAFDRAITEYASHEGNAKPFYLYEVGLDENASVSDSIAKDENGMLFRGVSEDVVRYINRWEDMASISLAVRPTKLVVRSKRLVEPQEAHRRISIYNVNPASATVAKPRYDDLDEPELLPPIEDYPQYEHEIEDDENYEAAEIFEAAMARILAGAQATDED